MSTSKNNITNLAELQAHIKLLKQNIKESETDFNNRWERLPQETIKVAVGWVIPFFLNNWMATGAWDLLKGIVPFFKKNKDKGGEDWKETVTGTTKKFGVSAILKTLFGLIKK